ncbi:MAG: alanine--tRNA ligase [Candidatus Izemoplasmataceae bacterium]
MKKMSGHDIKKTWLEFFRNKDHKVEESASLVPINDPTLLWINAGVAPLKGYFDGSKVPSNPRIVNVQKCIRTNDIENVGKTARHHTFFEMLGNFSIGDYFRDEAVSWAYEILTSEDYFGIDPERLIMSVYPTDDETFDKWLEVGVKKDHIVRSYENFWEIGPGPCGPSTEIFYDRGDAYGKADLSMIENDVENDRYVEIWNIVLSQFNAKEGLSREEYPELPSKNIDTGMGLERMATIMQGVETNFETDLFYPVIRDLEALSGVPYEGQMSFKVIADHIRSVVFALSDGATFSNDGRGYVLRRLLRRSLKHGRSIGIEGAFLTSLTGTVVDMMKETYPYLESTEAFAKKMIEKEEAQFLETLTQGEKILKEIMERSGTMIDGKDAFMLYDTYGFPVELTREYAESEGMAVDDEGFKAYMEEQRERARAARKDAVGMHDQNEEYLKFKEESFFVGYETTEVKSKVIKVFEDGVVTKETPFYAESGGQIADRGVIVKEGQVFTVQDVQKLPNGQFLHMIEDHTLEEGDTVRLHVDEASRKMTEAHHSATHLLFSVLREQLGEHVMQQGSLVGPDYLRFDFNHYDLPDEKTILEIEDRVNEKIQEAIDVDVERVDLEEAKKRGAIAEFGEKYDDEVRMVNMGVTLDLCGGTHVSNTADIGRFAIVSVESKGSGIYRITGLANGRVPHINEYMRGFESTLDHLRNKAHNILKKAKEEGIALTFDEEASVEQEGSYRDVIRMRRHLEDYQKAVKALEKAYEEKRQRQRLSDLESHLDKVDENGNLVLKLEAVAPKDLKVLADRLMEHMQGGVVFLADIYDGKVVLVSKSQSDVHAGNLVKEAAKIAGGGGGGRPDFAQAGGRDVSKVDDVLKHVKETLDEKARA